MRWPMMDGRLFYVAACCGHEACALVLLAGGANVGNRDGGGSDIWFGNVAAELGHVDILRATAWGGRGYSR